MARTILVTVGISLVTEHVKEKQTSLGGFDKLTDTFPSLEKLQDGLVELDKRQHEGREFNLDERKWKDVQATLVERVQALWGKELPDKFKRKWSGAELASLHLLGREESSQHERLHREDRVLLLASDTPSGRFCAETIAEILRSGTIGVGPVELERVRVQKMDGLRADDAELFLAQGLPNTAKVLADNRPDAETGQEALLIASGGYKGLLPYLTPIAMQLHVPLLYLYEDSDRLLEIQPLRFPDDLRLVKEFRRAFNLVDPACGHDVASSATFWQPVAAIDSQNGRARIEQSGLVLEWMDYVKLTSSGILACLLEPLVLPQKA
jgi:hypothetical protein